MKYAFALLSTGLLLAGCTTQSGSLMSMYRSEQPAPEETQPVGTEQSVTTDDTATETLVAQTAPIVRYSHNVALKEHNADSVTYEYKDIRVDEVASLAIRYCNEQGGKKAFLREIILYRNYHRRATFDCSDLATDK